MRVPWRTGVQGNAKRVGVARTQGLRGEVQHENRLL